MSEKRSESNDPKKMKRADKTPPVINYREYLDMDTDEEEFGRQETPEPDEELPAEPEKPVFTTQELDTLVQYVKNLTMTSQEEILLPQESIDVIHEYFCNPSHTILTIFHEDYQWKVILDFPEYPQNGLTYFFRTAWQIYTPDNFMSTVKFGSFNCFENSLFKFFQNIYAPVAFSYDRWPRVKKDEIFSNLNNLISHLNDATYHPMGLPILYVPREGINAKISTSVNSSKQISEEDTDESVESNLIEEEKRGLIERLEKFARYWIKQIREVLRGSNIPARPACRTILEEINFWNYRFESLNCLHNQLTNKYITNIIDTLKCNKSSSIDEFPVLVAEIDKLLIETTSNITYLNLFVDYCSDFEIPGGIDDYTTKILYLIRFVAMESQFYNSTDKIEILCRALGTQIINQSKKYIDLNVILDNDPLEGKQMLENSIYCCQRLKEIFNQLILMDRRCKSSTLSNLDESHIFNHVNTFIQRCQDLIEVTNTRIIFDKCRDIKIIGGAKAMEHEKKYKKIEKLFSRTLEEIKNSRECILDVEEYGWLDKIMVFRGKIEDVDNMMKNLIHDIFEDVLTVEEGLEALYAMKRFVIRDNLQKSLCSYWTFVWKIFDSELESIVNNIDDEVLIYDRSMTSYAGAATLLSLKNNYLTIQFNMLINASDWFVDNIAQEVIVEKYKRVQSTLLEKINMINSTWDQKLLTDETIKEMLNKPIIKYCNYPNSKFMEVNLNFYCLESIKSATEWKNMKYEVKKISPKLMQKWNLLMIRYIKVDYLCKFHNNIVGRMSKEEFMLFKLVIDEVKMTVTTEIAKNTWMVESIDKFYDECYNNVYKLRRVVRDYKCSYKKIYSYIKNISKQLLIKETTDSTYTLEDFETYLKNTRIKSLENINEECKLIIKSLSLIKYDIRRDDKTPIYWTAFVQKIIEDFKKSLVVNICNSLQSARSFFEGDGITTPEPLLTIEAHYLNDQIIFQPGVEDIKRVIELIISYNEEVCSIENFDKIFDLIDVRLKDKLDFIETNEEITELKNYFEEETDAAIAALDEFVKSINIIELLMEIEEKLSELRDGKKYDKNSFEEEILRCRELSKAISLIADNVNIRFIFLNTVNMKSQLTEKCDCLKDMLFIELSKFIAGELTSQR